MFFLPHGNDPSLPWLVLYTSRHEWLFPIVGHLMTAASAMPVLSTNSYPGHFIIATSVMTVMYHLIPYSLHQGECDTTKL